MRRDVSTAAIIAFLFATGGLHANDQKKWTSPNGERVAHAENHKAKGSADYTDWDVVILSDQKGKALASLSLEEGSGISLAVVTEAIWSPDSRFFVFQTSSSGGHSVWHEPTYVFDAKTSLIYSIDVMIGAITSDNSSLHFVHGDVLHVDLYNINNQKDSDPFSFPEEISLPKFVGTARIALHSVRPPAGLSRISNPNR